MSVIRVIPKGDLALANGTTVVKTGAPYATQRVTVSLDVFLGEWFLDLRIGIPYFRDLLIHSPNDATVRAVLTAGILNTPGIVKVEQMQVVLDTTSRIATVNFISIFEDGTATPQALALVI